MKNLREIVEQKVNEETFTKSRKDLITRMIVKFENHLINKNKNFEDINKEDVIEIINSIKTRSYSSMLQYHLAINDILKYINKEDCKLVISNSQDIKNDINMHEMIENEIERYYTKKEIIDLCNSFINPQDKFIVYAIFSGIVGKQNEQLVNLKCDDIDLVNKTIKIKDRTIQMDDYMHKICSDMLDPFFGGVYYKYMDHTKKGSSSDSYELNFKSEYAIKSKPYSLNNDGLDPMKNEGIKRRLKKLSEVADMPISHVDIARSGVMYRMNLLKKEGWTRPEIEEYLKQTNFRMKSYELKRLYELKYNKSK